MALYVKGNWASAPASPRLTSSYTKVGDRKSTNLDESASPIDFTDADSAANEYRPGRPNATIAGTFNKDYAGDAGALICRRGLRQKDTIYFLYTPVAVDSVDPVGYEAQYGIGLCTAYNESNPDQGAAEVSITIQITGALTRFTILT